MRVFDTLAVKLLASITSAILLPCIVASVACAAPASPANKMLVHPSPEHAEKDISVTIYNQNFGLVREVREIMFKEGINHIKVDDIAAGIDPTTVSFSAVTAPNSVSVLEQNYRFDLMDRDTILSRSVGKDVKFRQLLPDSGERILEGKLLSAPGGLSPDYEGRVSRSDLVIRTASGVVVSPQGDAELVELPKGLVAKPCLVWKLACSKPGPQIVETSYQTIGLNWKCDYVAIDSADDSNVDLTSWVTLDNKAGATFKNAALKLMAGDVHKVSEGADATVVEGLNYGLERHQRTSQSQFEEQSFAEYHLYSLAGRTTLHDNETKQLTLFEANSVPVKKFYVYEPGGRTPPRGGSFDSKVAVKIEVANTKKNNMGMAMPKGTVRVYKRDKDGALQFIGEDLIDHTPKDEKIKLEIGNAFDLVGKLDMKALHLVHNKPRLRSGDFELTLNNHKNVPVTITFIGHAFGDWKITQSSMNYTKTDSTTFEFSVPVEASSEAKVTYTIESERM
jgi:hypothetical protein